MSLCFWDRTTSRHKILNETIQSLPENCIAQILLIRVCSEQQNNLLFKVSYVSLEMAYSTIPCSADIVQIIWSSY